MGTAGRSEFSAQFSYGEKDYYLGNSPIWQLFRVTYRLGKKPYLTGGLALGLGYLWAAINASSGLYPTNSCASTARTKRKN